MLFFGLVYSVVGSVDPTSSKGENFAYVSNLNFLSITTEATLL